MPSSFRPSAQLLLPDRDSNDKRGMWSQAIEDEVASRWLSLAAALGLDFAGIDLRLISDGRVYCFEVNPSPAYSAFELATGQPIALALASYLASG